MKAGDLIHDARFLKSDGKSYSIVIEYGSGQTLNINGDSQLLSLNVSWLAGSTVKSLVRDNRTGAIHFVFIPDRKTNPYVHSGVDSFEWVGENVSGDVISFGMHRVSFSAKLVLLPDENHIEDELIGIDPGGCLARIIKPLVEKFGNIVDVKYSFSAERLSIEELQTRHDQHLKGEGKYLQGECWVEYKTKHYGEYLSTTQELEVGDYDLLGELEGRIGDYILLEIGFSKP